MRSGKRNPRLIGLPLLLIAIVSLAQAGNSQGLSDEQARERAKTAVRTSLGLDASTFLNPHRIEDLEESTLSFIHGQSEKPLYFFEVSEEGVENRSGQVLIHSSNGLVVQYVAIDRSNGEAYRLYGLKDAQSEFNRMAANQHFSVRDEADAELFALLYIQCVFGPGSNALIYSSHGLKHMVEDYFYGHNNPEQARRKFEKWWNGFQKEYRSRKFGIHAMKVAQGFKVNFDQSTLREGASPRVDEYSLEISPLGHCSSRQVKTLYPI